MDPQNNPNPTPTPNPEGAGPMPEAPVVPEVPEASEAPVAPEPSTVPVPPQPSAVPSMPEPPVAPVIEPSAPAVPEGIGAAPVNPVVNPGAAPVAPVFEPSGVAATDPIMMPEPAKAPDPVEEELKAPMKAAAPVPGSIGSAVSGPAEGDASTASVENPFSKEGQTPSVSFTDPATQPESNSETPGAKPKAKMNKNTLILLIVVAAIVVVALAAVLIMQLMNNNSTPPVAPTNTPNNATVIEDDNDEDTDVVANNTLSCTRNMTDEEIVKYNDAISGTINISAEFDDENLLQNVALVESVVYSDEDSSENEPVEMEVHESTADELNATSGLNFYLEPNDLGEFDFSRDGIQSRYESLDFTCEVL